MSSSCAVQGVVKLKREYLDEIHSLYQTPDQGFDPDPEKNNVAQYLFGVNVSNNIKTHFSEKAANGTFDDADFETGYLTFVSGFSSYNLEEFIAKVKEVSDHFILYCIYENPVQLHNELVIIENLNELNHYISKFNDPNFIESEIPFEEFDKNGRYRNVEVYDDEKPFWGVDNLKNIWEFEGD